jgi:uncharacterized protein YbjT (DUF2867 family)
MPSMTPTILAVGAVGPFAGLVVPELAKRGAHVRALIRDARQGETVRTHGAAEIAVGDLRDRASLDAVLTGVDAVFYIAPAFMAGEAAVGTRMVEAARRSGVRRFVFSSVIAPVLTSLANHRAKAPVEEAILESGMEYALLHPTLFFQNLAGAWPAVVRTGVLAEQWSTETRFTRVDYRDVAEVAAIALMEDRLLHGTYELCAEGNLDRHEVAALMSDELGRPITAAKLSLGTPAKSPTDVDDDAQMAAMRAMFAWYDTHGLLGNALTLRAILGREPRTLRAYIHELAATPQAAD